MKINRIPQGVYTPKYTREQSSTSNPSNRGPLQVFTSPKGDSDNVNPLQPPMSKPSDLDEDEVIFQFNPITPEDFRANVAPVIQLYQAGMISLEYGLQRLMMNPVEAQKGTLAPMPVVSPGQVNKTASNPRSQGGIAKKQPDTGIPKGSNPQPTEKPKEKKWRLNVGGETIDITENLE